MRFLVTMLDSERKPRAWGRANIVELAEREAERQLAIYIHKKNELGEGLRREDFTRDIQVTREDE